MIVEGKAFYSSDIDMKDLTDRQISQYEQAYVTKAG